MSRRNLPSLCINPKNPAASTSNTLVYPTLSFVNVNNPGEAKQREQRRAVRSHVAYYQDYKDDSGDPRNLKTVVVKGGPGRQRRPLAALVVESRANKNGRDVGRRHSEQRIINRNRQNASSGSSPADPSFRGTRIDPFQPYPVSLHLVPSPLCFFSTQTPSLVIHSRLISSSCSCNLHKYIMLTSRAAGPLRGILQSYP
jgi:hypothetical protein